MFIQKGILQELIQNNLYQSGSKSYLSSVSKTISLLTSNDLDATKILHFHIENRLEYVLTNYKQIDVSNSISREISLLSESLRLEHDAFWEFRLRLLLSIFYRVLNFGSHISVIAENILVPCFSILLELGNLNTNMSENGKSNAILSKQKKITSNGEDPQPEKKKKIEELQKEQKRQEKFVENLNKMDLDEQEQQEMENEKEKNQFRNQFRRRRRWSRRRRR